MKKGQWSEEEVAAVEAMLARPRVHGEIKILAHQLGRSAQTVYFKIQLIRGHSRAKRPPVPVEVGPPLWPACDAMIDDGPVSFAKRMERILREAATV